MTYAMEVIPAIICGRRRVMEVGIMLMVQASYCVDHLAQAQIHFLMCMSDMNIFGYGKRTISKFQHCFRPSTEHFLVFPDENK
jgi:hypothetical protein